VPDLLGDRSYRIPPLTDRDAHDIVREPKASPMLFGHRGSDPVAVEALEDLLLRLGRLADDLPEVADLDLNPVVVHTGGVAVLDGGASLVPVPPRADLEVRRLSTL
jgi:acyl-CoA synthetase (NDP forming)